MLRKMLELIKIKYSRETILSLVCLSIITLLYIYAQEYFGIPDEGFITAIAAIGFRGASKKNEKDESDEIERDLFVKPESNINKKIDDMGDLIINTDSDGRIKRCNRNLEDFLDLNYRKIKGEHINDLLGLYDYSIEGSPKYSPLEYLFQSAKNSVQADNLVLRTLNFEEFRISLTVSRGYDDNGNDEFTIIIRDIARIERIKADLHNAQAQNESLLNNIKDGFVVFDQNFKILEWNEALERISGLKAKDAINKNAFEVWDGIAKQDESVGSKELQARFKQALKDNDESALRIKRQYELVSFSGEKKSLSIYSYFVRKINGSHFASIIQDVSSEKKFEKRLAASDDTFAKIFNLSPEAIVIIDAQSGDLYDLNPAFEKLFGKAKNELIGKNVDEFSGVWADESKKREFFTKLASRTPVQNYEIELLDINQNKVYCSLSGAYAEIKSRLCFVIYVKDISLKVAEEIKLNRIRVELEEKVNYRNIELEQINRDLQDQISEREKTEKALRESEENYRSLINQLPVGIYRTTLDGRFLQANPTLASILGYETVEELLTRNPEEFYENSALRSELFYANKHNGEVFKEEIKVRRKDGVSIWINDYAKVIIEDSGSVIIDGIIEEITEQKIAQNQLKESESKFRKLFENLTDIYISFNAEGFITNISPSLERMCGLEIRKYLYRHISTLLSDDPENRLFLKNYAKTLYITNFTIIIKNSLGQKRSFSLNLQPALANDGRRFAYEGIARDITSELTHSNITKTLYDISRATNTCESLYDLFEHIHKSLGNIIDATNFFIAVADYEENLIRFPYLVDEMDEPIENIPMDAPDLYTAKVINSGMPLLRRFEDIASTVIKDKDDVTGTYSQIWLGVPLKVKEKVIGAMVVQSYRDPNQYSEKDIDLLQSVSDQIALAIDRKNSQIEIDNQLNFIENLLETIPNPVFYKDLKTKTYSRCNKAFSEHLGVNSADILGKTAYDFFPFEKARKYEQMDEEIINCRTQIYEDVLEKDGRDPVYVNLYRSCFYENSEVAGIVGVIHDITEQKIAQAKIFEALEKEKELNELKSNFISMVSHEYRTPLQSIMLSTELLRDYSDRLNEESRLKQFDRIKNSITHLNDMLDDILLLNKSERGKLNYTPTRLDAFKMTQSLVKEMQFIAKDKCAIEFVEKSESRLVFLDEKLTHLALSNLISNAIKYSPNGGVITVGLNINDSVAEFSVKDGGIGIPKVDQGKLFTPFFRCSNVGAISGTGLGLSLVRDAVKLQGGDISFTSNEGEGSTFFLSIPIAKV
jgi:PAS domain S-box-containing protein